MSDSPGTFGAGQPSDQSPFGHAETQAAHPDFLKKPAQDPQIEPVPTQQVFQPASFEPQPTQLAHVQPAPMPGAMPGAMPEPLAPELMGGEPVLVSIGDISVTATQVFTPSGTRPLSELQWSVTDMSLTSEGIPTWAIVCAVIFILACFLGLLFLLVKETSTKGSVQVTVHGPGFVHTTQIPVFSPQQIADIHARVNYVRTLNAAGPTMQPPFGGGQLPGTGLGQQPGQLPGQGW